MDEAEGVTDILRRHIIPHVRIFKLYHSEAWSEWNKKQEILCFKESKWLKLKCEDLASPEARCPGRQHLWLRSLLAAGDFRGAGCDPALAITARSSLGRAPAGYNNTAVASRPEWEWHDDTWGAVMMIACLTQTVGVVNKMNAIRMIKLLLKESDGWLIVKVMPRKDL